MAKICPFWVPFCNKPKGQNLLKCNHINVVTQGQELQAEFWKEGRRLRKQKNPLMVLLGQKLEGG